MARNDAEGLLTALDGATVWDALERAAEHADLGVFVARIDVQPARILYVNAVAATICGMSAQELVGKPPWSIMRTADGAIIRSLIDRPPGAPPVQLELMMQRPSGELIPVTLSSARVHTHDAVLSFGYFRDITHERETVEALRQSEARFRFLVEAAPDGVVILQRGTIVFINPRALQLLGLARSEDALGKPIAAFLPPADAALAGERIMAMFRDGVEFPPSEYGVIADPSRVVEIKSIACEWNGGPAVLAFARDVTERNAIQRRLVEADRLTALGTLAAGVAHEINNPLTYAQLSAQRISRVIDNLVLPDEVRDTLRSGLEDINHGIKRVASITHSLHSFVSRDTGAPAAVELEPVILRALKMVDNELRHAARLVLDLHEVPAVVGNASRLEQVLVNVLINAIKARPQNGERMHEVRVSLSCDGEHATIAVADTGIGIPAAVRGRIFDPFFTTRDIGHGMGLGLSVSKTIIEKYGGTIEIESEEHVGTTVQVRLRLHAAPAQHPSTAEPAPAPRASGLRVLVVDDEPLICQILQRILRDHHDVTIATSGPEALALLAHQRFDLILCDVMMPDMNADELHRRIAATHPTLEQRIVFMSGGVLGAEVEDMLAGLPNPRLAKPFRVEDVLSVVERSLR